MSRAINSIHMNCPFWQTALDELENLYVGWIRNPAVDVWNGFVDFHNARVEARRKGDLAQNEEEGMTATLDGKTYRIRELWFEQDFTAVLKKAMQSQRRNRR